MNIIEFRQFANFLDGMHREDIKHRLNEIIKKEQLYDDVKIVKNIYHSLELLSSIRLSEAALYPIDYVSGSGGKKNLLSILENLYFSIDNGSLNNILDYAEDLEKYIEYCGITKQGTVWRSIQDDLDEIQNRIVKFDEINSESKVLSASLKENNARLDEFNSTIKSRLDRVQHLQNETEQFRNSLVEIIAQANKASEKVTSSLSDNAKMRDETNELYKKLKEYDGKLEGLEDKYNNFISYEQHYNETMGDLNGRFDLLKSKEDYLNQLTGVAVGAKLFETFKQRKDELRRNIYFWIVAVIITVIASIFWIVEIFSMNDVSTLTWFTIFVSSLKSIPALFLMYFSISQFTKERNFQEEYAFKSTVALTIKAYVDQVKDDNNKDKLILDSLNEIYKSPVIYRNTKNKEVELIKDSKNDVLEIVKKLLDSKKS